MTDQIILRIIIMKSRLTCRNFEQSQLFQTISKRVRLSLSLRGYEMPMASEEETEEIIPNDRARSRLYRGQTLQENMRWKALAEIYTMHMQFCLLMDAAGHRKRRGARRRSPSPGILTSRSPGLFIHGEQKSNVYTTSSCLAT